MRDAKPRESDTTQIQKGWDEGRGESEVLLTEERRSELMARKRRGRMGRHDMRRKGTLQSPTESTRNWLPIGATTTRKERRVFRRGMWSLGLRWVLTLEKPETVQADAPRACPPLPT